MTNPDDIASNVAFLDDILMACGILAFFCIIVIVHSLWKLNNCIKIARQHGAEARKAGRPCVSGYTNTFLVAAFREGYLND